MQRSCFWRHRIIRMVGVKGFAGNVVLAGRNRLIEYFEYRGVGGKVAGLPVMRHDVAENTARLQELLRPKLLITNGQHVVTREVRVELLAYRVGDRLRQIQAAHFSAGFVMGQRC